jgi:hypothetical protein
MATATTAEVRRGSRERKGFGLGCAIPFAVHRSNVRKRSTLYSDLELLTGGRPCRRVSLGAILRK